MVKALPVINKPNFFQLHGEEIIVSYSTSGFTGKPQFSYHDTQFSKTFSGDAIRVAETEIGTLVSVTIVLNPDAGSTDFTLFLPRINLRLFETVHISTIGVTTLRRFSIIGPPHGQDDFYTSHKLSGSASFVEF